jgi:PAS domain S-box-containing protein
MDRAAVLPRRLTMDLLQRFSEYFSISEAPSNIYLDPDEARREKTKKNYHHHVFQIPFLRAFGLSLIALFVLLHNLYLVPTPHAWVYFWRLLAVYTFYTVVSWLVLLVWYSKVQTVHLGLFFLLFDIIPFLMAIYYSGGEKSWLFFLLMVRTADQARTTWRNALLFANVSTLGYVILLVYLWYFEHHAMSLPTELTKVFFIYASNVYLSFVSKAADNLRNRMKAAIHVSRDLIRRLEAQSSALQASESDYRALVEGSIQGVYIHQQGVIQLANPALARIFGYESPDVLIGLDHLMLAVPHERDWLEDNVAAHLEGRPAPDHYEYEGVRREGAFVWIECQVSNIEWRGAPAILATLQDITARRQAEVMLRQAHAELETRVQERTAALQQVNEALRASETKYRTLVENIPQRIFVKDKNSVYLSCNESYARDIGIQPGEVAGKTDYEFFPKELADNYRADDRRIMESGKTESIEERYLLKGEEIWVQTIKTPVRGEDGTVAGVLGIFWDITERKQAGDALRESETRFRSYIESAPLAIFVADQQGRLMDFNPAALDLLGYDAAILRRMNILDLHPEEDREGVLSDLATLLEVGHVERERRMKKSNGHLIWVSLRVVMTPDRFSFAYCQDISERKQLEDAEAQLRQAQKMESLGTLAGGIAHDFNNILGVIVGYSEMAQTHADDPLRVREDLSEVFKAAFRAKELVKQILAFSRHGEREKRPVQIGLIVKEALKMIRASLPSTIEIEQNVASKAAVMADPTQIHQVLMNLCTNGAHAMREDVGVLEVTLTDVCLRSGSTQSHPELQYGPHVKLAVKDTGHGIDPSILDRIFDPFFTTKKHGVGTGLGLSVVHGIVKSHGGAIEVESHPGKGTTFYVFLPEIESAAELPAGAALPLPCGRERILVVDDEPALAKATKQMLEGLGYQAEFRTNGIDALEAIRHHSTGKPFDLVITDMTMPHMTGLGLARELFRLQPNLPILLCTGFSENMDAEKARKIGIKGFLMKPVVSRELAAMIRTVLDEIK